MRMISKPTLIASILAAIIGSIHGAETPRTRELPRKVVNIPLAPEIDTRQFDGLAQAAGKPAQISRDLVLVRTIDTKPFAGGSQGVSDSESLAYCPQDDTFWIGDDDGKAVHQFARSDGRFIMKVTAANLMAAFPAAGRCVSEKSTRCFYTNELEAVACNRATGDIYIVNTVNDPKLNPPVDKQAIFKIRKTGTSIVYDSWHPLPPGIKNKFDAIIVIDGALYGGGDKALVEYDFQRQNYARRDAQGNPTPVYTSRQGNIVGLGYESPYLWVLTSKKRIVKVDWGAKSDDAVWDLMSVPGVKLKLAKGMQAVLGEFSWSTAIRRTRFSCFA